MEDEKEIHDVRCLQQEDEGRMPNLDRTTSQLDKVDRTIKYFSMFTGVGGFELGMPKGWECVGFSEIDRYASQVLRYRFSIYGQGIKNYGDATRINPLDLPEFDLLCGGFPCQSFSIAGKRRGFEDIRGTMFFSIAKILKVKRPKIVFLENVKGLLNHEKGETFRVILQTLDELGYEVQWMVLNSKFFGVPQNRERVFIIGSLRGQPRPEILPFGRTNTEINKERITHPTISGAIGRQGSSKEYMNSLKQVSQAQRIRSIDGNAQTLQGQAGGQGAKTGLYAIENPLKGKTDYGWHFEQNVYSEDSNCRSLKSTEGSGNKPKIISDMKIRRLTPIECERLQGFPDEWTRYGTNDDKMCVEMSDTQRYKMMGNAVTVNVISAITEKLIQDKRNI